MIHPIQETPSRVLVTGASGFIGRHVVKALLDNSYMVVAHCNKRKPPLEIANRCERVLSGDLFDANLMQEALRNVHIVCHLAAHVPSRYSILQDAAQCYSYNALATSAFAAQALAAGVSRFIYFSTGNMYGVSERPCVESDNIVPSEHATGYLLSKYAAEVYLSNLLHSSSMELVILRIGTTYGPGEPAEKVIPSFLRLAEQGHPLHVVNGGMAAFNFIFVADIANLTVQVIKSHHQGIYNVASGDHTRVIELANAVAALHVKNNVAINVEPLVTGGFKGFPPISIAKARTAFSFAPCSLSIGLRKYRESLMKEPIYR